MEGEKVGVLGMEVRSKERKADIEGGEKRRQHPEFKEEGSFLLR